MGTPPTSVLLPTVRWTDACDDVASQLGPDDELLIVCDNDADPVAARADDLPEGVRLVIAGDPEGCSGKANAIAVGMGAARHDRIVWTDDDFVHPPDWLDSLHADYERHGPVSEVPFFVGRDPLSTLTEPLYAIGGTLGTYQDNKAWGGAVMFERDDIGETAFLAALCQTVSDDGLLSEHLDLTTLRRARLVPVGGSIRESAERHVRFSQIVYRHEPRGMGVILGLAALFTIMGALSPILVFVLSTLLSVAVYAFFGVRRWTALLGYPAMMLQLPLFLYGLARRTFVWGGRRYRWRSKYDVEVVE
ncbi:glycosyltransferase [Halogeometricum borinquense]|uniref:Glycosyltransferase n=1 Tax=Halogeometricum borinquense TaxID=60847 RepID=A0A482TA42_9EURY|nr:glycosyltransferase family 2 protein [Halogeometricum borinquense]RYJ14794.1 glycosyltransferase [Halogeometricum borinquense]